MVTPASFRTTFPAFADTSMYPDAMLQVWITTYTALINADRWGDLTDMGIMLAVAHNLVLEAQAVMASAAGAVPGSVGSGMVNSKSVDKTSVGYDTTTASEEGAGYWNLTTYGTRWWRLAMLFGAGPVQVNTPGIGPPYSGGAWPGPIYQ